MHFVRVFCLVLLSNCWLSTASADSTSVNQLCPALELLPQLERHAVDCVNNAQACAPFLDTLSRLLPHYDCQSTAEIGTTYTVPAIWLAGSPAMQRYFSLLSHLAEHNARAATLFNSDAFQAVLDGEFAEQFGANVQPNDDEIY